MSRQSIVPVAALCAALLASACDSGGATPSPSTGNLTGQWRGTTTQGATIQFSVSSDRRIVSMSVGYAFNGCAGTTVLSDLDVVIFNARAPGQGQSFSFGTGPSDGPNYTQMFGAFDSDVAARGSVLFGSYDGCGNGGANWVASRE